MAEREHWDEYLDAYEDMIRKTATKHSPWYVVPANNKWFTRVVVAAAVVDTLASLDLAYPQVDKARLEEIASAKRALLESLPAQKMDRHETTMADGKLFISDALESRRSQWLQWFQVPQAANRGRSRKFAKSG